VLHVACSFLCVLLFCFLYLCCVNGEKDELLMYNHHNETGVLGYFKTCHFNDAYKASSTFQDEYNTTLYGRK